MPCNFSSAEAEANTSGPAALKVWLQPAVFAALPYLHRTRVVTVIVVLEEGEEASEPTIGSDAVCHLQHHGIEAALEHVKCRGDAAATLMDEARRRNCNLIAMGGYGHSRMREWLLGGVTRKLLHEAPVPLLLAH